MKVYIGNYRYRWVSYVHEKYMDKKYGRYEWEDSSTNFERALEKLEGGLQWIYNKTINRIIDKLSNRKIKVRIDPWDTWSMDSTLAHIVLPMIKQLKESKHGAPVVDDEDVPEELRSTSAPPKKCEYDLDDFYFKRWDWVLDEIIWAFEQTMRDDWQEDYYKYEDDPTATFGMKLVWEDREGRKAHQERMSNGFRLFGKYYESLWD